MSQPPRPVGMPDPFGNINYGSSANRKPSTLETLGKIFILGFNLKNLFII